MPERLGVVGIGDGQDSRAGPQAIPVYAVGAGDHRVSAILATPCFQSVDRFRRQTQCFQRGGIMGQELLKIRNLFEDRLLATGSEFRQTGQKYPEPVFRLEQVRDRQGLGREGHGILPWIRVG